MTPCYIFDIDGTLSNGDHRLHHIKKDPKDWRAYFAECYDDEPIEHICELARVLGTHLAVVYASGRSDECQDATVRWLIKHGLPPGPVYMRAAGNHEGDDILKPKMLERMRADGYEPVMAFDDRDRVVAAWRGAGVPCAQVAPGTF